MGVVMWDTPFMLRYHVIKTDGELNNAFIMCWHAWYGAIEYTFLYACIYKYNICDY